jgi:ORF6N domain
MSKEIIPIERVVRSIRWIRRHKVLLDSDLAILYGVTTGNVNKAVKRNADRFPSDFMFQLKAEELANFEIPICNIKMGRATALGATRRPRREIGFHVRESAVRCRTRKRCECLIG